MAEDRIARKKEMKKLGITAASQWVHQAKATVILDVAASQMEYGDRINFDGIERFPKISNDANDEDFAYGFYKKVKSWVIDKIHKCQIDLNDSQNSSRG